MPDLRFDVAIIGAGIIGTSIAWNLARRGVGSVGVLEKEAAPGLGSTSKAAGGIRAQFSSEINVRLSMLSIERFERFPREMNQEVVFHQVGYLWMATRAQEMRQFEANAALQRRLGLDVELLDPEGVRRKAPYVKTSDLAGGVFCGKDGYAPPADYVMGYHKKARELGVSFLFGEEVIGQEGGVLRTKGSRVAAPKVVIAAGAYSGRVGALLGVDLPVVPVRRQCFVTEPIAELPHPIPMTVDYTTGVYMHTESGGLLIGKADLREPPGWNENPEWSFLEEVAALAMDRVPILEKATIKTGWGGLYEVTPDHHPILGEVRPGLYAACGFSGHGVMHAPATGELMAELLVDGRARSLDISSLRLSRFQEGQLVHETNVI
jgi:sarcosine oxidase subunit beta